MQPITMFAAGFFTLAETPQIMCPYLLKIVPYPAWLTSVHPKSIRSRTRDQILGSDNTEISDSGRPPCSCRESKRWEVRILLLVRKPKQLWSTLSDQKKQ
jgi:hypothetical protein